MRFWRKWHRTISILISLPFVIILVTGILLTSRGYVSWLEPKSVHAIGPITISFEQILAAAQSVPQAKINTWGDVSQIDIRPSTAKIRIRSKLNNWEIQIDPQSAKVLAAAERRVGFITALHEGAYFGPVVRYGVFAPAAVGVLFLLISGWFLILKPKFDARRLAAAKRSRQTPVPSTRKSDA